MPLAEKVLQIIPEKLEEIPDDLQKTIEHKPDFLKKVIHSDSSKDYVLHIEFQKEDDEEMIYRMNEYCSILLRKYKIEIKQFVFYIDSGKAKMPTTINFPNLNFHFHLINTQDIDYQIFIKSNKPEEVILAILANFGKDKSERVISLVLQRLISLPTETLRREKCVKQLEILSNLRNLQAEIIKQLELMALTYDLEKDIRFKQGIEKGIEKGMIDTKKSIVLKLLKKGKMPHQEIAELAEVSLDFVNKIAKSLQK